MPTTNPIVMCLADVVGVVLDPPQAASNTPNVATPVAALNIVVHRISGHSSRLSTIARGPIAHPEP
jgi:hypothetical protein